MIRTENMLEPNRLQTSPQQFPAAAPVWVVADDAEMCAGSFQPADQLDGILIDIQHFLMTEHHQPGSLLPRNRETPQQLAVIPPQDIVHTLEQGFFRGFPFPSAANHQIADHRQETVPEECRSGCGGLLSVPRNRIIDVNQKMLFLQIHFSRFHFPVSMT